MEAENRRFPVVERRTAFALGAIAAGVVALVFATIGDGVDADGVAGIRAQVIDHGHTWVWVLLTLAFAIAALQGRWATIPKLLAVAAGLTYAGFLLAAFG